MSVLSLSPDVRAEAEQRLCTLEHAHGVTIFFAVESGSRAWGFPSPDSDYDVRFLYVSPVAHYLRLDPVRDVIESPIEGLWDVNGWDLRKALLLLRGGNAVLLEWLRSPLIYREAGPTAARLRTLAEAFASPDDAVRHYFGLLHGQYARDFGDRPSVRLKKYLYAVRAASALAWLRARGSLPPMALGELIAGGTPGDVRTALDTLLLAKAQASELGEGPRQAILDGFIEAQLQWARDSGALASRPSNPSFAAATDALFLDAVGIGHD